MKIIKKGFIVLWFVIMMTNRVCVAGFFNFKLLDADNKQPMIVSEQEEKQQRLQLLNAELATLQTQSKQQKLELKNKQAAIVKEISLIGSREIDKNNGFYAKKLAMLRDMQQALAELAKSHAQYLYILKQSIEVLESYLSSQQNSSIALDKTSYQLSDFQKLSKQFLSAQEDLNSARAESKRYEGELEQLEQKIILLEQDVKTKEQLKARFVPNKMSGGRSLEIEHQAELIDLQIKLAQLKKEVAFARRAELRKTIELNGMHALVAKAKRSMLKKILVQVERKVWVSDADVHKAEAAFEEGKLEHSHVIDSLNELSADLAIKRNKVQKAFEVLNKNLTTPVAESRQFTEWLTEPQPADEVAFYQAALLNQTMQTIDKELALLQAKQQLHEAYIDEHELDVDALKAWLLMNRRSRVIDDDERLALIQRFNTKRLEIQKELEGLKQKDSATAALISTQSRVAQQLQQRIDYVANHKEILTKRYGALAYQKVVQALARSQEHLNRQLDIYGQLIKLYAALTSVFSDMSAQLEVLNAKLEGMGGIWQRSAGALTLQGVQNALSDLRLFWDDIVSTVFKASVAEALSWTTTFFADPLNVLNSILLLIFAAAFYFLFLFGLPWLLSLVEQYEKNHGMSFVSRVCGGIFSILYNHLLGMTIWGVFLFIVRSDAVFDVGGRIKLVFYLLSIPYLCYLVYKIVSRLMAWLNVWCTIPAQSLISAVLYVFGFSTVVIQLGQEAFFVTIYGHSEVATLLYAAQSLITRAAVILLLINRDVVLALLPHRSGAWGVVRVIVDRFYGVCWLVVSVLIILSDPYVGYGALVSTLLRGALWSISILALFWLIHFTIKRYSSHLFFTSIDEGIRERFTYARTWYVAFHICSIILLFVLVGIFLARIWGYDVSMERIGDFFNMELAKIRGETAGQFTSFTIRSIVVLFGIIFSSFVITAFINRFVWHRVFELLEVDSGVQHTISRITGYIVFIVALVIGLYQVGLGSGVPWGMTVVLAAIAWSVKDPINDFFAYFILLVERSIKIGDYVRVNDANGEVGGVVRKITPRSVVLRKDNSFYLVVPNSKVLNAPFANWNYSNGYVAFEDIKFTIAYHDDPAKVKAIVLEVLSKNNFVLKSPSPVVRIDNFSEYGFDFMVRGFISSKIFIQQWDIRSDIRFALVKEFGRNHITFAVPQRRVQVMKAGSETDKLGNDE